MHPILSRFRRLGLYLLGWIPLAGLLAYLLRVTGTVNWREAAALAGPLSLFYAFVCLSAWYPCRGAPIGESKFSRLVLTNLTAAAAAASLWILAAKLLAYGLSESGTFRGLDAKFAPGIPLLFGTGILLYLLSAALCYVVLAIEASQEAQTRAMQASLLAREAELRALKAQVNPHFLFNSLNSISALTTSDSSKAREMCILLGDFLRRTLGLGEKMVIPLEEELSLIRSFLAVEKIRFGDRLRMQEEIEPEALAFDVPPLLLQPLVENAVAHGVAQLVEGSSIRLAVRCRNGHLEIEVQNDYDPGAPPRRRTGVGLANVRQRLHARYAGRASFSARADGGLFCVALTLPAEKEARPT